MGLVGLALSHAALVGALALAAASIGARLTRRVPFRDGLERAAVACVLGLGAIGYLVLALGLAHALTPAVALGAVSALALACAPWPAIARLDGRRVARASLVALALVLATAPLWGRALAPPLDWDAISYHLATAKLYASRHAVAATPTLRYPIFSRLQEMLFTLMLLAGSESAASGTQTLAVALTALLLFCAGRRARSPRAGLFAAALWLGCPLAMRLGNSGYIDAGLAMFCALAVTALLAWLDTRARAWLLAAAAAAGFAAASKYTGLVIIALLSLIAVAAARDRLKSALTFGASATVVAAPFYVLNFIWGRNPVFPFASGVFGVGPWWSQADYAAQLADLAQMGMGHGLGALALLPWRLAFVQGRFASEGAPLTPLMMLLWPVTLFTAWRDATVRRLVFVALAFGAVWFLGAQSLRYLMPILPALALAHALALDRVLGAHFVERRALVLAAGLAAWGLADAAWQVVSEVPPAPAQRLAYLERKKPALAAIDWLNAHAPGYRLYQVGEEELAYYADGAYLGDHFGPWRYRRVLDKIDRPAALADELRAIGATHFLLNRTYHAAPPAGPDFDAHFARVMENDAVLLYSLR
jgi:hypothetical protein